MDAARVRSEGKGAGRAIARAWRELTGGTGRDRDLERRTLIACSGGGDSSGLVLALGAAVTRAKDVLVVGHVVHDMRERAEALADRDAARALASRVGLPFAEGEVRVRGVPGNAEAAARRLRYAELERMAVGTGCGYVATAHHAEDQLETMLMALVRGAGPRGLSGIASKRCLGDASGVRLIRPALGVGRSDLRDLCEGAGWEWREDATNLDESRLRAAIRARIVPELERVRPGAAVRAGRAAVVLRGAAQVVQDRAKELHRLGTHGERLKWERAELREEHPVVLGELVRRVARAVGGGNDRLSARAVAPVVRAVRDRETDPRRMTVGGLSIEVTVRGVTFRSSVDG